MPSKSNHRGSAPLPPIGPAITTQEVATTPMDIGYDWKIVAVRPAGSGTWEPTMTSREDWKIVKDMMDDGTASTAQRRDQSGTVLLARLRGPE